MMAGSHLLHSSLFGFCSGGVCDLRGVTQCDYALTGTTTTLLFLHAVVSNNGQSQPLMCLLLFG